MEKEIENYSKLENQIDKIADLVIQLKEENSQLRDQNNQFTIQLESLNGNNHSQVKSTSNENSQKKELTLAQYEYLRKSVKNALSKLDQLRQAVMEASYY